MIRLRENINFNDYTLIIPSVSVGNVGQLTNDLLICALNLKSVGTVYHKALIPAVGPNPYDPKGDICVACELYACQKNKIAILQLRTSLIQKHITDFFEELGKFIQQNKFKEVFILTSSFAHERHDMNTGLFRYITSNEHHDFNNLNVTPMESAENGEYVIYGSGFANKLYMRLKDVIQTSVLIMYVSEGDNRPDAFAMYNIVNNVLGVTVPQQVKQPYSWNLVYGGPPPMGIY